MKILLTGAGGQLGGELCRALAALGEVVAPGRAVMDLAKPDAVRHAVRAIAPELIVNAAGCTLVDAAESQPERAAAVNGVAPGIMAQEARSLGAMLIHYSTGYVFDGSAGAPYTEEDRPNPQSVYGRSKLAGEEAIAAAGARALILRTNWLFGASGRNFMLTVLGLARGPEPVRIVDDQIGAPTWSRLVAEATATIAGRFRAANSRAAGALQGGAIYHLTAAGSASWCQFAQAILDEYAAALQTEPLNGEQSSRQPLKSARAIPIRTADYPTPARRPAYSVLDGARLARTFGIRLPDWRVGLSLAMRDYLALAGAGPR